tara:strand:+ start:10120 stop:11160 length:1041 start_codon:yes stop_codon:yes gene_type:complete
MFNNKNKIPLDKFINHALYNPNKGYYMQKKPFGYDGDFITAPNISIVFSEMIFVWLFSYWENFLKNKKINIVELGAGNGELMFQIINSAKKFNEFYQKCEFIILEKSKKLIKVQKNKLKKDKVKWLNELKNLNNRPTIFFGNEFLDALPIKQFIKLDNDWFEKYVQKKGRKYNFVNVRCDIRKIENKLNFKVSKNQHFLEVSFEELKIIKKLNSIISKQKGCILFIDYAHLNNKMFDTLQAVKEHKKISALSEIGSVDISHVVNIPYLKKVAKKLNLYLDFNTQRNFLLDLGIMKRAEILSQKKTFLEKANIFYRVNRLIDSKQMGELFKVIHLYKKNKKFSLGFK